jgi:hypothetical protein
MERHQDACVIATTSTAPKLHVQRVLVSSLHPWLVDRLWQLYSNFYDHVSRPAFDHDLFEKTMVFVGTDVGTGAIVGFSTALFFVHRYRTRPVGVYFSGDTIIAPRYWGQTALHRAVLAELLRWKLRHPRTRLYWYLTCSGYRTYLTLARNFRTYWPQRRCPTPPWELGLLDSIGRSRYGAAWRADRGVVSFDAPQPVLKTNVAPITRDLLALPEIAFFVEANPGYAEGDELAMLARVDVGSVLGMTIKWLRKALHRGRTAPARALAPAGSPSP